MTVEDNRESESLAMWGVHEVEIKVCSKCGQTLPMDLDVFVDGRKSLWKVCKGT